MPINGKKKGGRGERLLVALLKKHGFQARRSVQYCGAAGHEDVFHNVPGIYIECKNTQSNNIHDFLSQAEEDSKGADFTTVGGPGRIPVVFLKKNNKKWVTIMDAEVFLEWIKDNNNLK